MIELQDDTKKVEHVTNPASIKVMGIGGAGGNTVNSLVDSGADYIQSIAVNTDAQALHLSKADHTIQVGNKSTKGLGTGANPELGKKAAEEDIDKLMDLVTDTDIVFLTAGMGGGTGSGALPVVAHAMKEQNILTIAVVTLPFEFEGKRRTRVAQQAIENLKKEVDTLIIIPNQKLLDVVDRNVSMLDAFAMINDVLVQSVTGITDIITKAGHINVDFADVRTIMKGMGLAVMGSATATGENRAQEATLKAITSPLLENMRIKGAHGVLLNITGGRDLSLHEISEAANIIYEEAAEDAHIILGSVVDDTLENEVKVTIIATGFETEKDKQTDETPKPVVEVSQPEPINVVQPAQHEPQMVAAPQYNPNPDTTKNVENTVEREEPAIETVESSRSTVFVDTEDLDVPTFLRKESVEEDNQ